MRCVIFWKGSTSPGTTTVVLNRGETAVIFRQVPADICENCGEYYFSQEVAKHVLRKAEEAVAKVGEVEIARFVFG